MSYDFDSQTAFEKNTSGSRNFDALVMIRLLRFMVTLPGLSSSGTTLAFVTREKDREP